MDSFRLAFRIYIYILTSPVQMKIFMFVYEDTLCVTRGNWMAELKAGTNSGGDEKRAFSFSCFNSAGRGGRERLAMKIWKRYRAPFDRFEGRYDRVAICTLLLVCGKSVFARTDERAVLLGRRREAKARTNAFFEEYPPDWINNRIDNWIVSVSTNRVKDKKEKKFVKFLWQVGASK